jgi:hypothetical protein
MEGSSLASDIRSWILLGLAVALGVGASPPDSPRALSRDSPPPPSPRFNRPANAVFADDFADGDLEGWKADRPAAWSVRSGVLRADLPDEKQAHSFLYAGDSSWVNYAVDLDVCGMRGVDKGLAVRVRPGKKGLGIDLRGPGYEDLKLYVNELPVGSAKVPNGNAVWYHMRVEIRDGKCSVAVGGKVVFDQRLRHKPPPRGGIALSAYTGGLALCTVYYDNVVVTPLAAETPSKLE